VYSNDYSIALLFVQSRESRKRTAESCYFSETIFNCESFHGQSGNLACAGLVPVFFPLVNLLLNEVSNEQATAKTKFAVKPSVSLRR